LASPYINFEKIHQREGGVTYKPSNLAGIPDFNFAWFYTPSSGQAAQVVGQLTSSSATVYVCPSKMGANWLRTKWKLYSCMGKQNWR